jgi:RsiW-degrading membrane proteinase PrsW (M82 family)
MDGATREPGEILPTDERRPDDAQPGDAWVRCGHCGVEVEVGAYCSACGAYLSHADRSHAAGRTHAVAASAHEAVHQPALRSTPRPRLEQYRRHLYRWALVAGVLGVVATLLIANAGLATVLAALVVPVIYVASIHHAAVHKSEPLAVLALTVLVGGIVGAGLAVLSRQYLNQLALGQVAAMAQGRPPLSLVLFFGVTLPLVAELLKLAGPLLLRRWPRFRNEVMDGAVFGVASGVGFAAASTLVNYWPIIRGGYAPAGAAGFSDWTATLVGLAILRPLIHGTSSGLIGAAIWAAALRRGHITAPVIVGLGGAVVYSLGELLLLSRGTLAVLTLHSLVLVILLTTLRRTIHEARLLDARALGLQCGTLVCQNCHRSTEARVFCSHCGTALRAQTKQSRAD